MSIIPHSFEIREGFYVCENGRNLSRYIPLWFKIENNVEIAYSSVRNRSRIIAQHGVSNAKPSMVDLILRLPETNFQ